MIKTYLSIFILATLAWNCVHCRRTNRIPIQREKPKDTTPSCTYNDANLEIECYYLQADNMDMLQESLIMTSEFVIGFGVYLDRSDGPSIPVDIFRGYNVTKLTLMETNFVSLPYELLSNIDSPLAYLDIVHHNLSTEETTSTDLFLPFAESLQELELAENLMSSYDPGTFSQYTNLKTMFLNSNPVKSIGLELLNMYSLDTIDYWYNSISTIQTGAFRDLGALRILYLDYNNFTTLQEGAFEGLENSPLVTVTLSNNPWNCDCDLQWLKDWLNARNLADSSGARCAPPKNGTFNQVTFC